MLFPDDAYCGHSADSVVGLSTSGYGLRLVDFKFNKDFIQQTRESGACEFPPLFWRSGSRVPGYRGDYDHDGTDEDRSPSVALLTAGPEIIVERRGDSESTSHFRICAQV